MFTFIKKYSPYLILFGLVLVLFTKNYVPGTSLTGWDNLQTDLNPLLGIKRSLFAVWEEYQSFGLTSGLSHAADIVRTIFIWILDIFFPSDFLRYVFIFLMVFLGGAGAFKLISYIDRRNNRESFALLGAIFYILNYGTIQIFYLPWESFSVFFAFLPWEIWIFIKLLENFQDKRNWILLFIINVLATPQAYIQTVFVVYILSLIFITSGRFLETRSIKILKNGGLIIFVILLLNAFWIFPQIYSLFAKADVVANAKNNLLFTESVAYQNLDKGNVWNFLRMEGFYSDLYGRGKTLIFLPWKMHFNQIPIIVISLLFSLIFLIGLIGAFFKKTYLRFSFLFLFILIAIALLSNVVIFSQLHEILTKPHIINQVFRSSFTKFIIPYSLVASYGFAIGIGIIFQILHGRFKYLNKNTIFILSALLILIYSWPSFKGSYISSEMKVKIPSEYYQAVDFFKSQNKNKRIALLPEYTFLGWFNTKWGYNGSGFLWYGVEQPIVSRTFDVWSRESEGYFWELKSALEAEDVNKFENVLEKYNIDYLFYDKSLLPIVGSTKSIQYESLDSLIKQSKNISQVKQWDFITIYSIKHAKKVDNFVNVSKPLPNIGPRISLTNNDTSYSSYGDYATISKTPFDVYYPFLDLTTQTATQKRAWDIIDSPSEWLFTSSLPFDQKSYSSTYQPTGAIEFNYYHDNNPINFILPYSQSVEKNKLIVKFPKLGLSDFDLNAAELKNCSQKQGLISKERQNDSIVIKSEKGAIACIAYTDQDLSQEYGYLVRIKNENLDGQRFFFYVLDATNEQSYIEDRIKNNTEFYLIASRFRYGRGYSFVLNSNSYENIDSINKINSLEVFLIPYEQIKNFNLQRMDQIVPKAYGETNFEAEKINYFSYRVAGDALSGNDLTLYQAFDEGWKAYEGKGDNLLTQTFPFFFGKEVKSHFPINNWANGWSVLSTSKDNNIIIVYLPQYLEYLGFLILIITAIYLIKKRSLS